MISKYQLYLKAINITQSEMEKSSSLGILLAVPKHLFHNEMVISRTLLFDVTGCYI